MSSFHPEAGKRCAGSGEQHVIGLSKLSIHDSIKYWINTAVKPGEVCTEHMQNMWCLIMFVCNVEHKKWNKAEYKTQKNSEAHACHTFKFPIISQRW